jgi:hypothetical protein
MKPIVNNEQDLVFSYLTLRKAIGWLGISLPFTVSLGAFLFFQTKLQGSISGYYHTGTRDVFVGTLWAIGFFLLSYKGYEPIDNLVGNLACIFAVGITLFPTRPEINPAAGSKWISGLHFTFAALFFLTLIYFSLFLFTKTDPTKPPTERKLQRNKVYKTCGYVMAGCIALIAIYSFLPESITAPLKSVNLIFWLETIAVLAFGVSWLTKGEAILKDEVVN